MPLGGFGNHGSQHPDIKSPPATAFWDKAIIAIRKVSPNPCNLGSTSKSRERVPHSRRRHTSIPTPHQTGDIHT